MEIKATREDRGYVLIANFSNGFAQGWKMAVPESFREALDIKLTPRISKGVKEELWTQGNIYDFHEGDTIHSSREAYEDWGKALIHLELSVQIQSASPSGYKDYETIEIKNNELEIIHQKGKTKPKNEIIEGLVIKKQRINHGFIRLRVYRPNKEKTALEEHELIECTQDDFIVFLQTGTIRGNNNKLLNLFN